MREEREEGGGPSVVTLSQQGRDCLQSEGNYVKMTRIRISCWSCSGVLKHSISLIVFLLSLVLWRGLAVLLTDSDQ